MNKTVNSLFYFDENTKLREIPDSRGPYKNGLTIPETDNEICIGCGACEFACPVIPYPSIFVDGQAVHQVAKAPKQEELKVEEGDAFPF